MCFIVYNFELKVRLTLKIFRASILLIREYEWEDLIESFKFCKE